LLETPDLLFKLLNEFPLPIEVFSSDGTVVFLNRLFLEIGNIPPAAVLGGKYNLLSDPVMESMGLRERLRRAFLGEAGTIIDFRIPIQDLVDRKIIDVKPFETVSADVHYFPLRDNSGVAYVVMVYDIKVRHLGKQSIVKAKEYIEKHWYEKYDADAISREAGLSRYYFDRLFKEQTGGTMHDYYVRVKVRMIKKKLLDPDMSVREAFEACGVNPKGSYVRHFREIVGKSPSDYREESIGGRPMKRDAGPK
jgi:AraC-like DNA-binding protein